MYPFCRVLFWLLWLMTFSLSSNIFLFSQPDDSWAYQSYSMADGLSHPWVNDFLQDRQGFLWLATSAGLNRFDGYEFKVYANDPTDSLSLPCVNVLSLAEAPDGDIWVGTAEGIFIFDPRREAFHRLSLAQGAVDYTAGKIVDDILFTPEGDVWLALIDGLACWEPEKKRLQFYPGTTHTEPRWQGRQAQHLQFDQQGRIWISSPGKIAYWDPDGGTFRYQETPQKNDAQLLVRNFFIDRSETLWVGTTDGLFYLDSLSNQYLEYPLDHVPDIDFYVEAIFEDRSGNLWIGTSQGLYRREGADGPVRHIRSEYTMGVEEDGQGGIWVCMPPVGVLYAIPNGRKFRKYPAPEAHSCGFSLVEGVKGRIWAGTMDGALLFEHGQISIRKISKGRPHVKDNIKSIIKDEHGRLWMGMQSSSRFVVYQPDEGVVKEVPLSNVPLTSCWDKNGRLWFGSYAGLYYLDTLTDEVVRYAPDHPELNGLPGKWVNHVRRDEQDRLWVGTINGLYRIDPQTGDLEFFEKNGRTDGLWSNGITTLLEDSAGRLWIGTAGGGLHLLEEPVSDSEEVRFRHWQTYNSNLPNNYISSIVEGENGVLWLTAGASIVRFDPRSEEMKSFGQSDGLYDGTYNVNAMLRSSEGRIFMLTKRGLVSFHPASLLENPFRPPVRITDILVGNTKLFPRAGMLDTTDQKIVLQQAPSYVASLELSHRQNDFSFRFAALNFAFSHKNQYEYRLLGYDDRWRTLSDGSRTAQFTNIDPGRYTFEVRGANNDGVWSEESAILSLRIHPPWYATWWARTLFLVIAAGLLYGLYRFQLRRRLALAEAARLREIDETKTRLYTNITHEFRTPLTVLLGMADRVTEEPENWFREGMRLIKRQGRQLLRLVNQMLDLSKLESGQLKLRMVQGDVILFIKYITESFHSLAESKDIRLHLFTDPEAITMDYDPDRLEEILSNLLTNAIKFTPGGGDVYLKAGFRQNEQSGTGKTLEIQVEDTGIGIPEEQLPHIFDRFHQVEDSYTRSVDGTGIGLALTRELVHLMEGEIEVWSREGEGTVFTVLLPFRNQAPPVRHQPLEKANASNGRTWSGGETDIQSDQINPGEEASGKADLPVLLIVEDNADVVTYLRACLEGRYNTELAANGREGIALAQERIPDIIISDVMMPEVDGFELTRTLKEDERTSHIPIILLTAKADTNSRLEGLETGADAYLAKPFHREALEVRLRKMIELRRRLQERFGGGPAQASRDKPLSPDERFLRRLRDTLDEHLDEEGFGIIQLCEAMHISRMQLHRKLKALTGLSASHFVRYYRLERARELLETTNLNISEVAFKVGFRSHSYFTECFSDRFEVPPSEYRLR